MAVTIKPVIGLGTRVMKTREWTPIDACGTSGNSALQQDTAKFKEVTFCNLLGRDAVVMHVAVFKRASFTGSAITTELPASSVALMLEWNKSVAVGTTYSIKDFYMDKLYSECDDMGDEPIVAVWVTPSVTSETGYLDVIQRR